MKYRGNKIEFIEREFDMTIRLCNSFGFRFFHSSDKNSKWLKVKKAVDIDQYIQKNPFGKYIGISPIEL